MDAFCGGREHKTKPFFFSNFVTGLQNFTPEKLPTFDGLNEMEKAR